ncbi:hypothetical protein CO2235_10434 [Cupriavidus oxalaticus]|uniref:Uncharacterized protein n=1 Tax=Cupriavidus oxalaticus TaxID=96344 RepID=A0A375FZT1_9BURK|nr:hypothetical protein CO2235_10434 [Cupriavidus oxalaticus]
MPEATALTPATAPTRSASGGNLDLIRPQPYTTWAPQVTPEERATLRRELEQGAVLYFPNLKFHFEPGEERFLDARYSDGKSKNINLRANDTAVRGAQGTQQDLSDLYKLIRRYAESSESLIRTLFPEYIPHMTRAGDLAASQRDRRPPGQLAQGRHPPARRFLPLQPDAGQAPAARVPQHRPRRAARMARGRAVRRFRAEICPEDPRHVARPGGADEAAAHHQAQTLGIRPPHAAAARPGQGRPGLPARRAAAGIPLPARFDLDRVQRPVAARRHARARDDGADHLPRAAGDFRPHALARGGAGAHARTADAGVLSG